MYTCLSLESCRTTNHRQNNIEKPCASEMNCVLYNVTLWVCCMGGLDWTGLDWTGLVKRGLVRRGFLKHGFVKGGFVKHELVNNHKRNRTKTIVFV